MLRQEVALLHESHAKERESHSKELNAVVENLQ
jgi:hypothetical protein